MVPLYPPEVPSNVVSPLLTLPALRLLSGVVQPEEEQLWRSLGDCWNVPRYSRTASTDHTESSLQRCETVKHQDSEKGDKYII